MRNREVGIRGGSIVSLLFFILLLVAGLKTVAKYRYEIDDWHYDAALIASILAMAMITVSVVGFLLTFRLKKT